ncbi:MAG: hypothetical protein ABI565_14810 [Vicinamibacteria bacterium]
MVALGYLSFAAWAIVTTGFDPFFMVFIVPGVLLLVASLGSFGRA